MIYTTTVVMISAAIGAAANIIFGIRNPCFYWVLGMSLGALSCLKIGIKK